MSAGNGLDWLIRFAGIFAQDLGAHLHAGVIAALDAVGNPCSHGIEIDVGHRSGECGFVVQELALESALPESPFHLILGIRLALDVLVQTAHKPG